MESQLSKVEVIKQAIKQVMEEDTKSSSDDGDVDVEDDNHHSLLSKLMSQLEKLEAEPKVNTQELIDDDEKTNTNNINKSRSEQEEEEEVKILARELKKLKRHNLITHCLLSVMILLTVVWQISEVSIILKLKDGVNHPFRSIGNIFKRMITPPPPPPKPNNGNEEETGESSITNNLIESSPIADLKIPHVDLPNTSQTWFFKDGN